MTKRPLGIRLLAASFLVGGSAFLGTRIYYRNVLTSSGVIAPFYLALLALAGIGAGLGIWWGKTWGWWLASFYLAYAIVRYANTMLSIPAIALQLNASGDEVMAIYLKYGARIIGHGLLLFYLSTTSVANYFGVAQISPWGRLGLLFTAAGFLLALMQL